MTTTRAFRQIPTMLNWAAGDPATGWILDQESEALFAMHGSQIGMLSFGEVAADPRNFSATIDCSQPGWTGRFGLYLGFRVRPAVSQKEPGHRYDRLVVVPFRNQSCDCYFKLRYQRVYLQPQHTLTLAETDVPYPATNKLSLGRKFVGRELMATAAGMQLGPNGLQEFTRQLPIAEQFLKDWRGQFGVIIYGAAAGFRNFEHDLCAAALGQDDAPKSIHSFARIFSAAQSAKIATKESPLPPLFPAQYIHDVILPASGPAWVKTAAGVNSGDICIKGKSQTLTGAPADKIWYRVHDPNLTPIGNPDPATDLSFVPGAVDWQYSPVSNVACTAAGACSLVGITIWAQFGGTYVGDTRQFQGRCNAVDTDCTNATPPVCL
jgi:hypothetical protein